MFCIVPLNLWHRVKLTITLYTDVTPCAMFGRSQSLHAKAGYGRPM